MSCKPDDTVQSFKSKLVAAAATQFVSLEPWRPDSDEWGLQYRANKIERCDSTLRDSRTLHDYGIDVEQLPKLMLCPNFHQPTLRPRSQLSVSQLRDPEIRETPSLEVCDYKYQGERPSYESSVVQATDSGKWAHSIGFARRGGDPAHNTLPWLPDDSMNRAPGPARDWSKSSTHYQGHYLTQHKWCSNIYVQANVK